jgi:hypothetical protein
MAFRVLFTNPKGTSVRDFDDKYNFDIVDGGVLRISTGGGGLITNHFAPGTWIEVSERTNLLTPTLGPPSS